MKVSHLLKTVIKLARVFYVHDLLIQSNIDL